MVVDCPRDGHHTKDGNRPRYVLGMIIILRTVLRMLTVLGMVTILEMMTILAMLVLVYSTICFPLYFILTDPVYLLCEYLCSYDEVHIVCPATLLRV